MQRIDLRPSLVLALLAHPARQHQGHAEDLLQRRVALDPAHDVARHPAKVGAQRPQRPIGALELLGVGVALMGDQSALADALVGLAQGEPVLPGQPDEPLARAMHQPGVGRERHRLGLHRGVDDHLGEVGWLGRAGAGGDIQALREQGGELLLAHALAPARHRRAVERQSVLKELLAAEQLIIGVLDPALAQNLVGEVVHMLEDRQPCHLKANAEHSSGAASARADGRTRPNRPPRTAPPESASRSSVRASPADG